MRIYRQELIPLLSQIEQHQQPIISNIRLCRQLQSNIVFSFNIISVNLQICSKIIAQYLVLYTKLSWLFYINYRQGQYQKLPSKIYSELILNSIILYFSQELTMSQAIIKRVGKYKLRRKIGKGATAQVYEAVKQGETEKYAVKMMPIARLTSKQRQLITQQVNIIKSISHPNIVKLIDTLQTPNHYYIVFQYCEKGDLEHYLKNNWGPYISEQIAQRIMFCVVDAVSLIHSMGIVHRDLKLSNILLKKDCQIKLADFGFAKQIDQQLLLQTYCGTPITMAPQILQGKKYDKKCDIWSLGIIAYQLVFGKLPFPINKGLKVFEEYVTTKPLEIPNNPQTSPEFKQLLKRVLQKDPEKRFSIVDLKQSSWIKQGDITLTKKQTNETIAEILRNSSKDFCLQHKQSQIQEELIQQPIHQSAIVKLQQIVSSRLNQVLCEQINKIIQRHIQMRDTLAESVSLMPNNYELVKLLEYLDYTFLKHLFNTPLIIATRSDQKPYQISKLKLIQFPKSIASDPQPVQCAKILQQNMKSRIQKGHLQLQAKKKIYEMTIDFLNLMRRFSIRAQILFPNHHYHQISISHIIQYMSEGEELPVQVCSDANFLTIALQCKEKNQKFKQIVESLKNSCLKRIDDIDNQIHGLGYY